MDGVFDRVFGVARRIVRGTFDLIDFPFSFELLITADVASNFFDLANDVVCRALDMFVVHLSPLAFSDAAFRDGG